MPRKIYLIHPNHKFEAMAEQPYAKEHILQYLLEKYPDLLAGEQINPAATRVRLAIDLRIFYSEQERGFLQQVGFGSELKESAGQMRKNLPGIGRMDFSYRPFANP